MKTYKNIFDKIVSLENLFAAWDKFKKGKQKKKDVLRFEFNLEKNIFDLKKGLEGLTYKHGPYTGFYIQDPKQRHIHKASVRDRIIHHALFSILNPIFEPTFIFDSYSCRKNKGTHVGIYRLGKFLRMVSKNNHRNCYILKCDIKKFFNSVDHCILLSLIKQRVTDTDALWLIKEIIESFSRGLPIGNLTSQLFANIYLNELDQFVKHRLKIPFYIRYTDDFVIVSDRMENLNSWLNRIKGFLNEKLRLELHPHKISFRKFHQGIDFLGYIQFPHYRVIRQKTKSRILKKIIAGASGQSLQSYLGVLSHADSYNFSQKIKNLFWFNKRD